MVVAKSEWIKLALHIEEEFSSHIHRRVAPPLWDGFQGGMEPSPYRTRVLSYLGCNNARDQGSVTIFNVEHHHIDALGRSCGASFAACSLQIS